ncbi:MAG: methylated-DNA--[protein]-cysteine S-methyltransferase [Propionibacteriaceae bacterium]|nr:methylated-DNA--[protein]-cysteine S-methyltransferase [Propionibacteriaceae bacterium]
MRTAALNTVETPDGPFTIIADDMVLASGWTSDASQLVKLIDATHRPKKLVSDQTGHAMRQAMIGLDAYYAGYFGPMLAVPVAFPEQSFHADCRRQLRAIPRGHTITYSELALRAGNATAVRAAATACAKNPTALFVPCHRVVRADGDLGGYLYGLDLKARLLVREGVRLSAE